MIKLLKVKKIGYGRREKGGGRNMGRKGEIRSGEERIRRKKCARAVHSGQVVKEKS